MTSLMDGARINRYTSHMIVAFVLCFLIESTCASEPDNKSKGPHE